MTISPLFTCSVFTDYRTRPQPDTEGDVRREARWPSRRSRSPPTAVHLRLNRYRQTIAVSLFDQNDQAGRRGLAGRSVGAGRSRQRNRSGRRDGGSHQMERRRAAVDDRAAVAIDHSYAHGMRAAVDVRKLEYAIHCFDPARRSVEYQQQPVICPKRRGGGHFDSDVAGVFANRVAIVGRHHADGCVRRQQSPRVRRWHVMPEPAGAGTVFVGGTVTAVDGVCPDRSTGGMSVKTTLPLASTVRKIWPDAPQDTAVRTTISASRTRMEGTRIDEAANMPPPAR